MPNYGSIASSSSSSTSPSPSTTKMATMTDYDNKDPTDRVSDDLRKNSDLRRSSTDPGHAVPRRNGLQPPPLVAAMSPEERVIAEGKMRRKIDWRLMPMVILMYVMNYLDRNNIAAVRLAGLQDELQLTSTQYQVRSIREAVDGLALTGSDCDFDFVCGIYFDAEYVLSMKPSW